MASPTTDKDTPFIETPNGIFTAAGNWFHTTVDDLEDYAHALLAKRSVASLIHGAEVVLRSPVTLLLWLIPPLLYFAGWPLTIVICIASFLLLSIGGPLINNLGVGSVLNILDKVPLQALYYIVFLSWFALNDRLELMGFGLLLFILLRWGAFTKAFQPITSYLRKRMFVVPYDDQVLKSVIVRSAMSAGAPLPELDKMERFILNRIHKKK